MNPTRPMTIFCGGPLEHDSERIFLRALVDHLARGAAAAVVLCNFQLKGRQIDFVVATEDAVALIEAKATKLPVRGEINGPWERLSPSGEWTPFRNPYQQALDAKNRLRDAMAQAAPIGDFYPDGFVAMTGDLPAASTITAGDFKVRIGTTAEVLAALAARGGSVWSLAAWQGFARSLKLTATTVDAALAAESSWAFSEWAERYRRAFAAEYQPDADLWIPEDDEQAEALIAFTNEQAGSFLWGPSGCGKSLMAKWLGVQLTATGAICLFVSAKLFSGSWAEAVQREISLLVDSYDPRFLRRATQLGIPVILIFDGLNELSADNARQALRGLKALARRYEARVVVTSQESRPEGLAGLSSVSVGKPSETLKARIAERGHGALTSAAKDVLRGVRSGLEARIVGEIGNELRSNVTRLELVDQFIRTRLGPHARAGSLGLRRLAARLTDEMAYSLSETAFDEFMLAQRLTFDDCEAVLRAGVLETRSGRVSFSHEIFQSTCAAQELVRLAQTDPAKLGVQLGTPLVRPLARDIIAALDTEPVCRAVLDEITDADIIADAADGELGSVATATAWAILETSHASLLAEIAQSTLVLTNGEAFKRLEWQGHIEPPPTSRARYQALGVRAAKGTGIEEYLVLCRAMDTKLQEERSRLAEAAREGNVALRSEAFALAYYGFGSRHSFTLAATQADATRFTHIVGNRSPKIAMRSLAGLTSGELLFVLKQRHELFGKADVTRFTLELTEVLRTRWRYEPYHVRLELLHIVGFVRDAEEMARAGLVEAINALEIHPSNWALNSSVIDALKMLGALDDEGEGQRTAIHDEVAAVIGEADSDEIREQALSVYTRMFDHPFDWIYAEEVYGLPEDTQRLLYRRAFQADGIGDSMSVRYLAQRIAEYEEPSDAPLFSILARLPSQTNPMSQDEMAAFVLAVRFLARHAAPLPVVEAENDAQRCMVLIRTLVYAAESGRDVDREQARAAWEKLHAHPAQRVIGCLAEINEPLAASHVAERPPNYPALNLVDVFPVDLLAVSRKLVDEGLPPTSYHRVGFRDRDLHFAFGVIAKHGDPSDLGRLRRVTADHPFAQKAIEVIRAIETSAAAVSG